MDILSSGNYKNKDRDVKTFLLLINLENKPCMHFAEYLDSNPTKRNCLDPYRQPSPRQNIQLPNGGIRGEEDTECLRGEE